MTAPDPKLSPFPKYPEFAPNYVEWLQHDRDAYRERMEAAIELLWQYQHSVRFGSPAPAVAEVDALLAACERKPFRCR